LQDNPIIARELLVGLMPETESKFGDWQLNYCVLQSIDVQPVLLDYTWLMDGRLAFYLVDLASDSEKGTATTLLIRALFNDYIRTRMADENNLNHLVQLIEKGMKHSDYSSPIKGLFGIFSACDRSLNVFSLVCNTAPKPAEITTSIMAQPWLGQGAINNDTIHLSLSDSGGRLSLSEIDSASFSVTLKRLDT